MESFTTSSAASSFGSIVLVFINLQFDLLLDSCCSVGGGRNGIASKELLIARLLNTCKSLILTLFERFDAVCCLSLSCSSQTDPALFANCFKKQARRAFRKSKSTKKTILKPINTRKTRSKSVLYFFKVQLFSSQFPSLFVDRFSIFHLAECFYFF